MSRNEMTEVKAKKAWYEKSKSHDERRLLFFKRLSKVHVPAMVLIFIVFWWILGIRNYNNPQ